MLVVLGTFFCLEAFSILEYIFSRAGHSSTFLVGSQGEVLRAPISYALVLGFRVDMLSVAVNFEAFSIFEFISRSARYSYALSVDKLEFSSTTGSDAFASLSSESFSAVAQADTIG